MAEILLINPYYSQKKEYYSFIKPSVPMGLMYLAAYLRKFGLKSRIIELGIFNRQEAIVANDRVRFGLSNQKILSILKKEKPKIVGITSMYSVFYRDVIEIAATIKKFDSRIKVVVGGNHPSSYYQYILKDKDIDFAVIGEGEQTFLELCQAILRKRKNFRRISGIALRKNGKVVRNKLRELITDLDEIPFPARDLIDFDNYLIKPEDSPYPLRYPSTNMITSRGCPGKCLYCTVRAVWGRTWRGRSPENVLAEIELLKNEYGVKDIAIMDDSASVNKKRWQKICEEIARRKIDIKWTVPNGISHWFLDKPMVKKMWRAGCYRITFGIESGNPLIRRFLGKPYPLKQAKELIRYANQLGMWTICTFIIGSPNERLAEIRDTIEFAKKSGTDFSFFYHMMPMPTAEIYDYFKKENLVNFDYFFENPSVDWEDFNQINYALNETGVDNKYFKKEELQKIKKKAWQEFLIYRVLTYFAQPQRVLRKIKSWEDFFYILRIIRAYSAIIWRTFNPINLKTYEYLFDKDKGTVR